MANRFSEFFSKLFGRKKGSIIIEKTPFYIYKKRTALDYLSLYLGIIVAVLVIFNLVKITGLTKVFNHQEHIAIVRINGTIAASEDANGYAVSKGLRKAFENENSKAVILRINSGGGSPYHAEMIWNEVRYLKKQYPNKPVYAVVEDMGASAAYYIASSADQIYVRDTSIIGSIGVLMTNYDIRDLMGKAGVKDRTFYSGENKIAYSMSQDITPEQETHLNNMLGQVHQNFIDSVKTGRGKRISNNLVIYSGRFWTGSDAIKLGIADKIGDMNTIKRELKLDEVQDYTISKDNLANMLGLDSKAIAHGISNSLKGSINELSTPSFE